MTFRNEVLEGIAAFGGVTNALKDDPRGDYYRYMLNQKKKADAEDAAAFKKGAGGNVNMPTAVTTGTPTAGGWGQTVASATAPDPTGATIYNRNGGMVRGFAGGGYVDSRDDPFGAHIDQILAEIPTDDEPMDYADQRARSGIHAAVGYPEEVNPNKVAKELNERGQRDREAIQVSTRKPNQAQAPLFGQRGTDLEPGDPLPGAVGRATNGQYFPPDPSVELNDRGRADRRMIQTDDPGPDDELAAQPREPQGLISRAVSRSNAPRNRRWEDEIGAPDEPTSPDLEIADRARRDRALDTGARRALQNLPNAETPPPVQGYEQSLPLTDSPDPSEQLSRRGAMDRVAAGRERDRDEEGRKRLRRQAPTPQEPPPVNLNANDQIGAPTPAPDPSGQLSRRGAMDRVAEGRELDRLGEFNKTTRGKGETGSDEGPESTSGIERALGLTREGAKSRARVAEIEKLETEKTVMQRTDWFKRTTPEQRQANEARIKEIDARIAQLKKEGAEAQKPKSALNTGKPAGTPTERPTPVSTDETYRRFARSEPTPGNYNDPPVLGPNGLAERPTAATPATPPGQRVPTGPNGPQTPPTTTGVAGQSPSPAPPPGAARPAQPAPGQSDLSQPGEDGFAAARRRGIVDENGRVLPQGAINTAPPGNPAGNPGMDAQGGTGLNPQGSNQGMSSNNAAADFQKAQGQLTTAVAGAAQAAQRYTPQQLAQGAGAVSPQTAEKIIRKFGANGRLTRGEAIMAGMVEVFKARALRGDTLGASQLALGIMQYANLEAAQNGREAINFLQNGDIVNGVKRVVAGHDMIPDGIRLSVSPDGQSVIATDLQGKTTALPMDGRWILAAAQGLANGSLLWNTLNSAAQMVKGSSKVDPEEQALKKDLLRARIRKLNSAGTGGGGVSLAQFQAVMNGQVPPQQPQVNVTVDGGGE